MKRIIGSLLVVFVLFEAVVLLEAVTQFQSLGNTSVNTAQFPATSQVTVSTSVPIAITATYMVVESTGSTLLLTSSVAITTSTAVSGQFLVAFSTTPLSPVQIATGTATGVIGDDAVIVISSTKSAVSFVYNSTLSQWVEIGKQ